MGALCCISRYNVKYPPENPDDPDYERRWVTGSSDKASTCSPDLMDCLGAMAMYVFYCCFTGYRRPKRTPLKAYPSLLPVAMRA
jgi:hypothetical protein